MVSWREHMMYMFPLFPLLMRVVVKICKDNTDAILIAPFCPCQPWFARLMTRAKEYMRLPYLPHLLTQNEGTTFHPDVQSLHLTAWRILPR